MSRPRYLSLPLAAATLLAAVPLTGGAGETVLDEGWENGGFGWAVDGQGMSIGVGLQTGDSSYGFGTYPTTDWYTVRVIVADHAAQAELFHDGVKLATSPVRTFDARATTLAFAEIMGVNWGRSTVFRYDDMRIVTSDACLGLAASLAASPPRGPAPFDTALVPTVSGSSPRCSDVEWTIDFGDGTPPASGSGTPPATVPHTYAETGTYTARLAATRPDLTSVSAETTIVVDDPCSGFAAALSATETIGSAPLDTTLLPSMTAAPPECGAVSWTLDPGDGNPTMTGTGAPPTEIAHTYEARGVYAARLDAARTDGANATATLIVRAGPVTQTENGLFAFAESYVRFPGDQMETAVTFDLPAYGGEAVRLAWTSPLAGSDLGVFFLKGSQRLAITGCALPAPDTPEACTAPAGATGALVRARTGTLVEWTLEYQYA